MPDKPVLRVAMVGYAFMGAAHSQAWRNAHRFFDLPAQPSANVLCGRTESATRDAAERMGWASWTTDWRDVLDRDDVQVVDICTPGDSHAEIAIEGLGKHAGPAARKRLLELLESTDNGLRLSAVTTLREGKMIEPGDESLLLRCFQ